MAARVISEASTSRVLLVRPRATCPRLPSRAQNCQHSAAGSAVPHRQRGEKRKLVLSKAGDGFDPFGEADDSQGPNYDDLNAAKDSPMFNAALNPMIAQEAQELTDLFKQLSSLQPKYNSFDVEGKKIFLKQMEDLTDKLQVFTMRYRLSDDPYAQKMVGQLQAQMQAVGLTIDTVGTELGKTMEGMRKDIEQEERLGASIVNDDGHMSQMGRLPDFGKLLENPEMAELYRDPEVFRLMQKCVQNPEKFKTEGANNPKVQRIIEIIMKTMEDDK